MSFGPDEEQSLFRALADPTRRAIVEMLAGEPKSVGAIADRFEVSRPAIAKHLKILEEGGLIVVRTMGRERINTLAPGALRPASVWLAQFDQFWDDRLDALKQAVEGNHHE